MKKLISILFPLTFLFSNTTLDFSYPDAGFIPAECGKLTELDIKSGKATGLRNITGRPDGNKKAYLTYVDKDWNVSFNYYDDNGNAITTQDNFCEAVKDINDKGTIYLSDDKIYYKSLFLIY